MDELLKQIAQQMDLQNQQLTAISQSLMALDIELGMVHRYNGALISMANDMAKRSDNNG